jgi:hypothetical protein
MMIRLLSLKNLMSVNMAEQTWSVNEFCSIVVCHPIPFVDGKMHRSKWLDLILPAPRN